MLLALGLAAIGVFIDLETAKRLGVIFQGVYFLGCVIAVCGVQRRAIFGPMVQPPLILAITVPTVVLVASGAPQGGLSSKALAVGTPLINGFPTMAVTTGITLLIGVVRLFTQRKPAQPAEPRRSRPAAAGPGNRPDPRQAAARRPSAAGGRPAAGQARPARQQPREQQPRQAGDKQQSREQPPRQPGKQSGQPARRPGRSGRPAQQRRPEPPRAEPPRRDSFGFDDDLYTD